MASDVRSSATSPSLQDCISSIKSLLCNHSTCSLSPSQKADLYVSAVSLLQHLSRDRGTIVEAIRNNGESEDTKSVSSCPPPTSTPAIKAVLEDKDLFQAILSMLNSSSPDSEYMYGSGTNVSSMPTLKSSLSSGMAPPHVTSGQKLSASLIKQKQQQGSRKRALSSAAADAETPNKVGKYHISPGSTTERSKVPSTVKASLPFTPLSSKDKQVLTAPEFNAPVFAATIFYAALQHLDHWPVDLIKAYAEDSFGPRIWVDDNRCQLLVKNLATVTSRDENVSQESLCIETIAAAKKVADFFARRSGLESSGLMHSDKSQGSALPSAVEKATPTMSMKDYTDTSDSDSGDEECLVEVSLGTAPKPPPTRKPGVSPATSKQDDGGSDSSSSGEEEVLQTSLGEQGGKSRSAGSNVSSSSMEGKVVEVALESSSIASSVPSSLVPPSAGLEPWYQRTINMTKVRPRYVGANKDKAFLVISEALAQRLESKTKQKSSLLSTLPSFISIPRVRCLASRHLERWLQSPALSVLARPLFSSIVSELRNVDPPLQDDLDSINSILSMKLKANQLTAHIENVKRIAQTIPTLAISRHIFVHLLREEMLAGDSIETQPTLTSSDHLRMFVAVYEGLPPYLAAGGLASGILALATDSGETNDGPQKEKKERLERTRMLLRRIADILGPSYDGYLLIKSLTGSEDHDAKGMPIDDAEDKARVIFECMALVAPPPSNAATTQYHRQHSKLNRRGGLIPTSGDSSARSLMDDSLSEEELATLNRKLSSARKVVLRWCATTLAGVFLDSIKNEERKKEGAVVSDEGRERKRRKKIGNGSEQISSVIGAGSPIFASVLDGHTPPEENSVSSFAGHFLSIVRCLLFLVKPDSRELRSFLFPWRSDSEDVLGHDLEHRIRMCSEYGAILDNEMMWAILNSEALTPATAISLIENVMMSCRQQRRADLLVTDCGIVWKMYDLVEYTPKVQGQQKTDMGSPREESESDAGACGHTMDNDDFHNGKTPRKRLFSAGLDSSTPTAMTGEVVRLAYPGLWWRVTSIALVMCGMAPKSIGSLMWMKHPTLKALIKMTTSGRYRFPTSDCDEHERDEMKQAETRMREKEANIAELLFMPESSIKMPPKRTPIRPIPAPSGLRVSARQRQKQERQLALLREQEAAAARAEAQRIKKLLRMAQKSIMIWDPRATARKPPKDSVDLILSIDALFGLAENFRLCTNPDFLLKTIGHTSRSSIERAYDWLIPIISTHPTIIDRLPPSASCFLLLRAYGTEGDKNSQLLELSAPLLVHVSDCLKGVFGEENAMHAEELLLQDIADSNPDRRRCARRVLQEALGSISLGNDMSDVTLDSSNCGWLFRLLRVKHATALIANAIKHVSHALAYERGRVLRTYVLALHKFIAFAHEEGIRGEWNFVNTLCELLSVRPHVCSDVFDRFSDFRDLALTVVHGEFVARADLEESVVDDERLAVKFTIRRPAANSNQQMMKEVIIPSPLLRAAVVILSNWQEVIDLSVPNGQNVVDVVKSSITSLMDYLVVSREGMGQTGEGGHAAGAASAFYIHNGKRAVSVEEWVALAKSRADFIARHAALSAPDVFLPRLLLCCGLPRAAFATMLERLGKMGDSSSDLNKSFGQLLSPTATSEWDVGHLGAKRVIQRKLLGRVSAYLRVHSDASKKEDEMLRKAANSSFVKWLSSECQNMEKAKKSRSKKGASNAGVETTKFLEIGSFDLLVLQSDVPDSSTLSEGLDNDTEFVSFESQKGDIRLDYAEEQKDKAVSKGFIEKCCRENLFEILDTRLEHNFSTDLKGRIRDDKCGSLTKEKMELASDYEKIAAAKDLLSLCPSFSKKSDFVRILVKWVPLITQSNGESRLWEMLFAATPEGNANTDALVMLASCCASMWSDAHIAEVQKWIVAQMKRTDQRASLSLPLMLRFIVATSGQDSVHAISFECSPRVSTLPCVQSQDSAAAAISLCMECAKLSYNEARHSDTLSLAMHCAEIYNSSVVTISKTSSVEKAGIDSAISSVANFSDSLKSRNVLPTWLMLLLLVAKCGKKHLDLITRTLLEALPMPPTSGWEADIIPLTLLRLYSYFPEVIGLSDPKLRKVLIDSSGEYASTWRQWRSPLDQQTKGMIQNLSANPHQRLLQAIVELSKRHPLIVTRHLISLLQVLKEDGSASKPTANALEKKGRIIGKPIQGVAVAKTGHGVLKVIPVMWGYSFTEPVWMSVLEILLSLPSEVAFSCGPKMGLLDLLDSYMVLFDAQRDINSDCNTLRLREKFLKLLATFQAFNESTFQVWMNSKIKGYRISVHVLAAICSLDIGIGQQK